MKAPADFSAGASVCYSRRVNTPPSDGNEARYKKRSTTIVSG